VVVCGGFTQALALLCGVLVARGARTMAVEAYGHRSHRDLVARHGLRLRRIPVDACGAVVDRFGDADAALLTPAHQFPFGVPLAPRRRTTAVRWAADRGALLVEDDYDGEFRYDRQAVGAVQALAPDAVAYAGSASKTLAPGVRLGWLVPPAHLLDDVVAAKAAADRQSGALDQLTLAELITSGGYDRHVRHCRLAYRRRRDRLVALLHARVPPVRVTGIAAGLHAVVELPSTVDEREVVAMAAERGLALHGLSAFGGRPGPALVVGYGTPPAHAFSTAVARLVATLREVLRLGA